MTTQSLLQTLNAGITGITAAPTAWPQNDITTFPTVLAKKGDDGRSRKVAGKTWNVDNWELYLFLAQKHQGTYETSRASSDTFVDRFRNTYTDPDNATLQNSGPNVQILSYLDDAIVDSGLAEIEYRSKEYYGVRFTVQVQEKEL